MGEHIGDKIFGVGHFGSNFGFSLCSNVGSYFQSSMPASNRSRSDFKRFIGDGVETVNEFALDIRSQGLRLPLLLIPSNSIKLVLLKLYKKECLV